MAYAISDDCISCGACAAECPVSAISEGDGKFVIDADTCIECGELKKIKCPTLVLAGEFDIIRKKETHLIADSIPNSTLRIIKGKGHGDYVVNSDYLRGTITEYIL